MSRWPIQRLGDLALVVMGQSPPGHTYNSDACGLPFFQGKTEFRDEHPEVQKWCDTPLRIAEAGDVLLSVRAPVGPTNVARERCCIGRGLAAIRPKTARLAPRFLRYFFTAFESQIVQQGAGSTFDAIGRSVIESLEFPLPPLPEQERIVRVLDEAEALRRLRADADERTSHIRAALFDKMFGNASSNSKGWETATLGRLGTVITGNTPPRSDSSFYGDFIEWVKTDNIDPTRGVVTRATEGLSEGGALRGRLVPAGAVLVTCIAGSIERIGDAAVVDREVAINQQINALIPSNNVASAFLAELVLALREAIQNRAAGVMTRIINKSTLEAVPAICPPRPLQGEFESHVETIRQLQASQAASRQRLADLFESLLHRAFEGEL